MPGKRVNSQVQQMVLNLLQYFEREKINGGPLLPLQAVQERVANALDISHKTVRNIKNRSTRNAVLESPGKKRPRKEFKTNDLDEPVKMEICNTVYNMCAEKKPVTVKSLNVELKRKEMVRISNSSLNRVLHDISFKFKKEDNRRALEEKTNIASMRAHFLRKYVENTRSKFARDVVFLDETWIYAKGTARKSWQDDSVKSVRKSEGFEGKRYIILHAGTNKGFVPNADLLFTSKSATGDYHGEMNSDLFTRWVTEKLIPNLEEPSLIIMDNAPYHSVVAEKHPTASWKKRNIIQWLTDNNISFENSMVKTELLNICKMHRKPKQYVIDELVRSSGHEVLRLPPYHCEFNAIELIWSNAKKYYDENIGRDGYGDDKVLDMWNEALNKCDSVVWSYCCRHTDELIKKWYERELHLDDIEPLTIEANISSSSEQDCGSDSE